MNKENVRELACEVVHCNSYSAVERITKWLEQNQPEPVVVGLSDGQLYDIAQLLASSPDEFNGNIQVIKNYLAAQTFTQPNESLIADNLKLSKELEQLKSQQFQPNWDDAPKNTYYARLQIEWLNKMYQQIGINVLAQQERPKSDTLVEPKQRWMYKQNGDYYVVTDVQTIKGLSKFDDIWIEDQMIISYVSENDTPISNAQIYTRPFTQFISKFEYLPN